MTDPVGVDVALEQVYKTGYVTVYEFDDDWFIQRLLCAGAGYALVKRLPRRHITFGPIADLQQAADQGKVALYVLRRADRSAHSFAFLRLNELQDNRQSFSVLDWTTEVRGVSACTRDYIACRAYWMPFVMDTVWAPDEHHKEWNNFHLPTFLDDRVYERLGNPDPKVKAQIDNIFEQMNSNAYNRDFVEDLTEELHHHQFNWIVPAFAEGAALDGVAMIYPTPQELSAGQSWMFEYFEFRLVGDPDRMSLQCWSQQASTETGGTEWKQVWVLMRTDFGEVLGNGPTPLAALQEARIGKVSAIGILPSSERDTWIEQTLKSGAPTFDMEPYDLLDVGGPVVWTNDRFRAWADEEFP